MSGDSDANIDGAFGDSGFQSKLGDLRKSILCEMCPEYMSSGSMLTARGTWVVKNVDCSINFEKFVSLTVSSGMHELAAIEVFNAFDVGAEGTEIISRLCTRVMLMHTCHEQLI